MGNLAKRKRSKPAPVAKIAEEAGRAYVGAAESALATATPAEARKLGVLFAGYADGLHAKVLDRNAAARLLISWGKNHDRGRCAYFGLIETTNKILTRALSLSPSEHREELLRLATRGLQDEIERGCPVVTWPEDSVFPIHEPRVN